MTKKQLIVKVSSLEDSLANFKNVWERAEKGEKFSAPIEILSFENSSTLMKTLSPKRLELLKILHVLGTVSIRLLAKELHRDYSNVHQDVKALHAIGVILESEGKYYVPWETIVTEILLCSKDSPKHNHHKPNSTAA
ncbi:MAG TPA: HTH domain-containing protein [Gammaproteobacteria bacterium]|nr:HTH domain-containing protein [Gammaproteobacteria bacterium]